MMRGAEKERKSENGIKQRKLEGKYTQEKRIKKKGGNPKEAKRSK